MQIIAFGFVVLCIALAGWYYRKMTKEETNRKDAQHKV